MTKQNKTYDERDIARRCFNCGQIVHKNQTVIWYHADQDDLVCLVCADKLKHTDTAYAGLNVLETSKWGAK